jgi:cation-transporting ATPase E
VPSLPQVDTASQLVGLTSAEVAERVDRGCTNTTDQKTSRTVAAIVGANVLTRFNAIISGLLVVILIYGELPDALFGLVMVINSTIGIVQETRAKRTLDALRQRIAPTVQVIRDGTDQTVSTEDLVIDDVIWLSTGDAMPVDGTVIASEGLETDESSLSGEADPVAKAAGDAVRSGSAVVAGSGLIVATAVGDDAWAHRLNHDAREFQLTDSGLRSDIDRLLGWLLWILIPVAALLLVSQLDEAKTLSSGLVSAVSGVVAMVPQGLVLLVSLSFAVAVLRLAENHVVVQELAAVEGLARVDVICLDKTGTLTTGELELETIESLSLPRDAVLSGLAALAAIEKNPNLTMQVIAKALRRSDTWELISSIPFSSSRKWSAALFRNQGIWIVGAPERLLAAASVADKSEAERRVEKLTRAGRRVLLVAHSNATDLDADTVLQHATAVGLVSIREKIRPDAAETLAYLRDQDVAIKIVSGDNHLTVAAIARELGVPHADRAVDLTGETDLKTLVEHNVIFGRVQPEQKRALIAELQRSGHTVAMTGDGVNDVLALKQADIGIAMDTASPAAKAVAQLVLLDGRYDRLPVVIAEGRRIIANMERASALFVTKTVYATLLAVSVSIAGLTFPFLPRHLTLVATLTIGVPAFVLSFWPSDSPARPGFLRRTLQFAIPAGMTAAIVTFAIYAASRSSWVNATQAEAQTAATLTLALVGLWILYRLIRPLARAEWVLLGLLLGSFGAAFVVPPIADFFALDVPGFAEAAAVVTATALNILALEAILRFAERHGHTLPRPKDT